VKWFIRSIGAPQTETILNLWRSLVAFVTCSLPPWTIEAREAEAEEAKEKQAAVAAAAEGDAPAGDAPAGDAPAGEEEGQDARSEKAPSTRSSVRDARSLARYKRIMTATGFIGTYICWAIFAWCVRAALSFAVPRACAKPSSLTYSGARRAQVYLRVRHAHLQAAGRQGAAGVRALLGCVGKAAHVRCRRRPHQLASDVRVCRFLSRRHFLRP
jgi:hypothetical protein